MTVFPRMPVAPPGAALRPAAPRRARLLPLPMLVVFVLLATTPLWLARVGLYQYLALEVMIWMLFALGYNLMLGTTGLPSFGHGAFFGVGAYAFGLLQQRVLANLWFDLAGAVLVTALFAMAQQSAYPNVMSLHSSGFVVMMVLIGGGLVSFWGPVIGAVFFILARDVLGATTETWLLWYGLLFVVMVLCKPEGIAGLWQSARRQLSVRKAAPGLPHEGVAHGPV